MLKGTLMIHDVAGHIHTWKLDTNDFDSIKRFFDGVSDKRCMTLIDTNTALFINTNNIAIIQFFKED